MNDTSASIGIVITLILQLVVLTIRYKIKKPIISIAYVNASIAIGILLFWGIDTLFLKQHQFETREVFIGCLEVSVLLFALYAITGFHHKNYVKIINQIGFWFHVLATIGMLIFMYTFKIDRLF